MPDEERASGTSWDPEKYEDDHGYVYEYGRDVLDLLEPQAGERILDLGCGTGHLTSEIAAAVDERGAAVGIDTSPAMIAEARDRYPDVAFAVADARTYDPDGQFDAVFSNAALHWIPDQDAVVERMAAALQPGGRFVAELGGRGNVDAIVGALLDAVEARGYDPERSWYFPSIGEQASRLDAGGFETRFARLFDRPTELAGGADGLRNWIGTFGDVIVGGLDESEREAAIEEVEAELTDRLFDPATDTWTAEYRRLRFVAVRTGE